jgi:O-antigen/teichoic acid export membrane protein
VLNGYNIEKTSIILALVAFKAIESIADAVYGILQSDDRLYIVGKSLLYKSTLGLTAFITIDLITNSILLGCIGILIANVLITVFYDMPHTRRPEVELKLHVFHLRSSIVASMRIMRRCAPIALVIFLTMFSLNIPRYFIDLYYPDHVGPFGIIAMPITLLALLISFILQPNIMQLSRLLGKNSLKKFKLIVRNLLTVSLMLGLIVLIVTYLIGVQLLQLVFGLDFTEYKTALLVIVIGAIVNALVTIYINILTIMRHFKAQLYALVATNISLAIVSALIVRQYGLIGGATLYALVNLIQVILLFGIYRCLIGRKLHKQIKSEVI